MGRWRVLVGWLLIAGCSDSEGEDTGVELLIAPADGAHTIGLRVWNTSETLVVDSWVGAVAGAAERTVELPWRVGLQPSEDQLGRRFRAEVDLFDANGCPFSRASTEGGFREGVIDERRLDFAPLDTAACEVAYVNPSHPAANDSPSGCRSRETPCATLSFALANYTGDPDVASVLYLEGGELYRGADNRSTATVISPEMGGRPGAPTVVRPRPGTGMPVLDAEQSADAVVSTFASHVVVDGFEIRSGIRHGYVVNGADAQDNVLRNSWIHSNGAPIPDANGDAPGEAPRVDAGIAFFNGSARGRIEFNRISDNGMAEVRGHGIRIFGANGAQEIIGNTLRGNTAIGIGVREAEVGFAGTVVVQRNVVCDSGQGGVSVDRAGARVERNTVVRSGAHGLRVGAGVQADANLLAFNEGEEVTGIDGVGSNLAFDGDIDPGLTDVDGCVLTLLPGSPAIGAAADGTNVGAF
ncbi:MAG: right-handed parallel beta-helix repeat-containing protein [Myxococcota bacterium]